MNYLITCSLFWFYVVCCHNSNLSEVKKSVRHTQLQASSDVFLLRTWSNCVCAYRAPVCVQPGCCVCATRLLCVCNPAPVCVCNPAPVCVQPGCSCVCGCESRWPQRHKMI